MHATAIWEGGYRSRLNDGRGHELLVDLPREEGGGDVGTSALELQALALAGCISTIFALVAERRRLAFDALSVRLTAERPKGAPTVTAVRGTLHLSTSASIEEVDTCLRLTVRTCPVGVLFEQAHVPVRVRAVLEPPRGAPTSASVPATGAFPA